MSDFIVNVLQALNGLLTAGIAITAFSLLLYTLSFNLRDRERWIGWTPSQKKRRLSLVVNNSRFVVRIRVPNLASRVMKLCVVRVSPDWLRTYNHEVLVAESFVDSQLFQGTCYKASGWTLLGQTQGFGRARAANVDASRSR